MPPDQSATATATAIATAPTAAPAAPAVSKNEVLKAGSNGLAGTIAQTLASSTAEKFNADDEQLIKFHGLYQQTDRDNRDAHTRTHTVMVRTRQTGGIITPEQYLLYDSLATRFGNDTLRLTTRQTVQIHGVALANLHETIRAINEAHSTTLATAGDINRNITAPPQISKSNLCRQLSADTFAITQALLPNATAYHQIWLDGKKIENSPYTPDVGAPDIYGPTFLPRKFKIAFAIPPRNDTELFTNDLGLAAVVDNGHLVAYDVYAGGGMGATHGIETTFPRLADYCGRIDRTYVADLARAALTIHRDFGDRANRRHARLKYLIAENGIGWFVAELEKRLGQKLAQKKPKKFTITGDDCGWHVQRGCRFSLTLFIENGRIKDTPNRALKTALREVIEQFHPRVFLTPSQNIIFADMKTSYVPKIDALLAKHNVIADIKQYTPTRLAALACPALPTCPLAITEAERALPAVLTELEKQLVELNLQNEAISVRMTGCPNGCARPHTAEIAFIGRGTNKYNIHLGGNKIGSRLNTLWKEAVPLEDLIPTLLPLLQNFKTNRRRKEPFGDFITRTLHQTKNKEQPAKNHSLSPAQ
jgi:sulfite reductase beta subunit-like hemoprotein